MVLPLAIWNTENPTTSVAVQETWKNLATSSIQLQFLSLFQVSLRSIQRYSDLNVLSMVIDLSGWWDVSQETRRCSATMKTKMEDILDKMISIRPDLHRSSFEVSGNDCTLNTKKRKPPTFKQLFSGNTKLHKNLRRWVSFQPTLLQLV